MRLEQRQPIAFANVALNNIVCVVNSENGPFVSMPKSKDKEGGCHDIAFPLSGGLREISLAAFADCGRAAG